MVEIFFVIFRGLKRVFIRSSLSLVLATVLVLCMGVHGPTTAKVCGNSVGVCGFKCYPRFTPA
jgi:hypothetical protein